MISKIKTLIKILTDKDFRFCFLADKGKKANIDSEEFLKVRYRVAFGRELNLDSPDTYTEKLQWLKLYDHCPEYTTMVDKYAVKQYVAEKIGAEYVIPLLGVWDDANDVDFDILPDQFVLKTTHDSGTLLICKNKAELNLKSVRKKFAKHLKRHYFDYNREWPYKNVRPRIIAEPYLEDKECKELRDYKFFTFGGVPKILYITQGRGKDEPTVADFFDMEFNHLPFKIDHDMSKQPPCKPKCFDEMKSLAALLSKGTPQLRVDFYEVDGQVYFGEMTFFHCSGLAKFHPDEWDKVLGDWVKLPSKNPEN